MGGLVDFLAGAFCIGAGVYLLSASGDGLSLLIHGAAIYFIGKGLFIWRANYLAGD